MAGSSLDLCLRSGLAGFPKHTLDQHILLKSVVLTLDKSKVFTEQEINAKLKYWIDHLCQIKNLDYITLRRMLIDIGYLKRNNDGSSYEVSVLETLPQFFDETIEQIDVLEVIKIGQEEIARRKREYMKKQSKNIENNILGG